VKIAKTRFSVSKFVFFKCYLYRYTEVMFESIPQLAIQLTNQAMTSFTPEGIISAVFSAITIYLHLYKFVYFVIIKRMPLIEVPMGGSGPAAAKKHALPTTAPESAAAADNKSKLTTGGGWVIGASLTSSSAATATSTEDVELAHLQSRVVNLEERVSLLEATPEGGRT
jgi:hypothetical protein